MKTFNTVVVLAIVLALFAVAVGAILSTEKNTRDGSCGESCSWTLNEGTLTISGSGKMDNYSSFGAPWYHNYSSIQKVEIKKGVKSIGNWAFYWFENMVSIEIPDSVTYIGSGAFWACSALTNLTLPSSVEFIGNEAFSVCRFLASFDVDENSVYFKSVDGVLYNYDKTVLVRYPTAKNGTNYTIPDGVQRIEVSAFWRMDYLQRVIVPSSVTSIGYTAFGGIPNAIMSIEVDEKNVNYKSIDGVLFDHNCTTLIRYPTYIKNNTYSIPDGVQLIEDFAFHHCILLTNVTIPDSVITIGKSAFGSSVFLQNVVFGENVTSIGVESFNYCRHLMHVTIPASVNSIGQNAFSNCDRLSSVFYQGSNVISTLNVFDQCKSLNNICVSPSYDDSSFCGMTVNSSDTCSLFQTMFNHCYIGACVNGSVVAQKRKNATELENENSYGCVHFQCENKTGALTKAFVCEPRGCHSSQCNEADGECVYEKKAGWNRENECYEVVCEDDEWIVQKRDNATEWEKRSDGCTEYHCNNKSGLTAWNKCNSTNDKTVMCINNQCVEKDVQDASNKASVEIELDSGINILEMNTSDILALLSAECQIDREKMTIGWETDDQGYVVRVVVYVSDEETAKIIADAVDKIDKGEGCKYGVLCHTKRVQIPGIDQEDLSEAKIIDVMINLMVILFIVLIDNAV